MRKEGDTSKYVLTEISLDGTNRKNLFEFSAATAPPNVAVHRGKFYAILNLYDEEQKTISGIWQYHLDNPAKKPSLLYQVSSEKINSLHDILLYGNYLYFSMENPVTHIGSWHYCLNLKNNHVNRIFQFDDSKIDEAVYNLCFFNNQLVMERYKMEESVLTGEQRCHPYIADLEGKNVKEWIEVIHGPFGADENYFYRWPAWAGGKLRAVEPTLQIYNREGEMLVNYDMTGELTKFREVFISPGEHVFLYMPQKIYYFSKSEIPSGTITPKVLIDLTDSVRY